MKLLIKTGPRMYFGMPGLQRQKAWYHVMVVASQVEISTAGEPDLAAIDAAPRVSRKGMEQPWVP
jgi:hypothetical protein